MGVSGTAKIKLTSLDELLGNGEGEQRGQDSGERIVRLPLDQMHDFRGHPFRVCDDARMAETVESIREHGVLMPGIVRPDRGGGYELIAGHRRRHASRLAGLSDMPVIIKELTDDESTVLMVDSNIQREDLLPSERARAYRMKYDALKRMGVAAGSRSDEVLAKEAGESRNTIQRYIRLTYLEEGLLKLVDENRLPKVTAAELSYLKKTEQRYLLMIMERYRVTPSGSQAARMKQLSREGGLDRFAMESLLVQEDESRVSLRAGRIRDYFPREYTGKQIEETVYMLLEAWKSENAHKF